MLLLYLAAGGAIGTVARFALAGWFYDRATDGFPWGTLVVNAVGSLFIGFVLRMLDVVAVTPEMRGFLTIGLLSGFTTFSTYSWETVMLARDNQWMAAGAYAFGSLFAGVLAVLTGLAFATLLIRLTALSVTTHGSSPRRCSPPRRAGTTKPAKQKGARMILAHTPGSPAVSLWCMRA